MNKKLFIFKFQGIKNNLKKDLKSINTTQKTFINMQIIDIIINVKDIIDNYLKYIKNKYFKSSFALTNEIKGILRNL